MMVGWSDDPDKLEQPRWSPDRSIAGTDAEGVHITDRLLLMVGGLVLLVAVVAIAVMMAAERA